MVFNRSRVSKYIRTAEGSRGLHNPYQPADKKWQPLSTSSLMYWIPHYHERLTSHTMVSNIRIIIADIKREPMVAKLTGYRAFRPSISGAPSPRSHVLIHDKLGESVATFKGDIDSWCGRLIIAVAVAV